MAVQKTNKSDEQARPLDSHSQGPTYMSNNTIWEGGKKKIPTFFITYLREEWYADDSYKIQCPLLAQQPVGGKIMILTTHTLVITFGWKKWWGGTKKTHDKCMMD